MLMQMLLEGGADARAMDINGCAPIQYLLKVTGVRPMGVPHLCYQLLLNHNAARVYPPQFHKVRTGSWADASERLTPNGVGTPFVSNVSNWCKSQRLLL